MSQHTQETREGTERCPALLVGLICSSCGLGFSAEKELRDHQLICRSSLEFLSQFESAERRHESLN